MSQPKQSIPTRSKVRASKPAAPKAAPLASRILAKLRTSALDEKDLKLMQVKPAPLSELQAARLPVCEAMSLPYFGIDGKATGFKRYRYLEDTRTGFMAQTDAKAARYVQPPDSHVEVYLPPHIDWSVVAVDAEHPITITEGELKAAACSKHFMPCIGLGGVYSFKSKKRKQPVLPIFDDFVWLDRIVYIAYDSDARTNPMVAAARNALCRELLARGAQPYVVDIPPTHDNEKQGIDDLIFALGVDELSVAMAEAKAFSLSQELHKLNAEVAYIKDPGLIVVLDNGLKMRPADFTSHAYANRHYFEEVNTKDGGSKMVMRKAAQAWLEWPMRMELTAMAYEPGKDRITEKAEYNTWQGWGCEPKAGSVKPWKDLLDHLFAGSEKERDFFERWCALPLQQPGAKMYTAAVLWGIQTGTGKSLTGYTLKRIYGENFTEIGDVELQDERHEWAVDKQFVMGDDVTGHDQRQYADRLKKMITQQTMRIDKKYVPSYTVRDCINYLFTANHPDAFFLEDNDRRFFVHEVEVSALDRSFYKAYMQWLDNGGAEALFHHLLSLDLKGMEAEDRAPDTIARRNMISDGMSDLGCWVRQLRDTPDAMLKIGEVSLRGDLWSAQELLALFDPEHKSRVTLNGLSRELKRAGIAKVYKGMPVPVANTQIRLFAVRNAAKWVKATAPELRLHWEVSRKSGASSRASKKKF